MNGSFVFVSGEANFIHKVRNRILTEKERHNKSAHTRTHKTTIDCKHAEELKNHPKWRLIDEG